MSFCHLQVHDPSSHMGWHTSRVHTPVDNSAADSNIYLTRGHRSLDIHYNRVLAEAPQAYAV